MTGADQGGRFLPDATRPEILLSYQKKLLTTVSHHAVTVCEKSRRIGVTWGIGAQAVLLSGAERSAGGMNTLYIGYNLDMAREFIDVCGQWAKAFNRAATDIGEFLFKDGDKDIQAFRIAFASGFVIVALASRPRSLRGRQGFVILDEFAFHDDPDELLKAALALLVWGGKVLVISTHDGAANPFNTLVEDCRKGRKPYALLRITFDDAVADGLYDRVKLKLESQGRKVPPKEQWVTEIRAFYGEDADEELDVNPKQGTGVYLPASMIESRMMDGIPIIRWALSDSFAHMTEDARVADTAQFLDAEIRPILEAMDPGLMSFFGQDFARSGDLSVLWPVQMLPDLRRRPPFVLEMRNVPFEAQKQVLFYIVRRLPRFMGGALDATGNGAYLAEVAAQEFGFDRIAQIKLNESWYREQMPRFKDGFESGLLILPRNDDILADHRSIRLVKGVPVIPRGSEAQGKGEDRKRGAKRHGDSAIAHVLADYATRLDVPDLDACETAGARDSAHVQADFYSDNAAALNQAGDRWESFQ